MIRTGKSSGTEKAPSEVYTVVHRLLVAHPSTMVSARHRPSSCRDCRSRTSHRCPHSRRRHPDRARLQEDDTNRLRATFAAPGRHRDQTK